MADPIRPPKKPIVQADSQSDDNDEANLQTGNKPPQAVEDESQFDDNDVVQFRAPIIYPSTVAQADQFCAADPKGEFPQQIFVTDPNDASKTLSLTNCAQLFAAKAPKK